MGKTLIDALRLGLSVDEKNDILLSLMIASENGQQILNPYEIQVMEDNQISISRKTDSIIYCSPEQISRSYDGSVFHGNSQQALFSLGLLGYLLYTGEDYYEKHGMSVLDLASLPTDRTTVIRTEDVLTIPYGKALVLLTSVVPDRRSAGMKAMLQYFSKELPGEAVLVYDLDGKDIGRETRTIRSDIDNLYPDGCVTLECRKFMLQNMPCSIPYRPGTHIYRIKVQQNTFKPVRADMSSDAIEHEKGATSDALKTSDIVVNPLGERTDSECVLETFPQPVLKGIWLFIRKTEKQNDNKSDYECVLSLSKRNEKSIISAAGGYASEILVVSSEGGKRAFVLKRAFLQLPDSTAKLRFHYQKDAERVIVRMLDDTGNIITSSMISVEDQL